MEGGLLPCFFRWVDATRLSAHPGGVASVKIGRSVCSIQGGCVTRGRGGKGI